METVVFFQGFHPCHLIQETLEAGMKWEQLSGGQMAPESHTEIMTLNFLQLLSFSF